MVNCPNLQILLVKCPSYYLEITSNDATIDWRQTHGYKYFKSLNCTKKGRSNDKLGHFPKIDYYNAARRAICKSHFALFIRLVMV